jgi:hypothetical protein
MKQRIFGLVGLGACLIYILFFGLDGIMSSLYLKVSFAFMLLGSVGLISTDTDNIIK